MVAIQRQRQEKVTTSPTAVDSSVTHRLLMMAVRYTSWWAMVPNCARLKCPFSEKGFHEHADQRDTLKQQHDQPQGHPAGRGCRCV